MGQSDASSEAPAKAMGRRLLTPAAVAILVVGIAMVGIAHAADGDVPSWSITTTPNPSASNNDLASVSCMSATFCVAVGGSVGSGTPTSLTLVETWDGTTWTVVPSLTPTEGGALGTVSCTSPTFCMAIGSTSSNQGLAESWNGVDWSVLQTTPLSAGQVSCTSPTFCMAVGADYSSGPSTPTTTTATWNGAVWTTVSSPDPSTTVNVLAGVSCTSPSFCVAVGTYHNPADAANDSLMLSWDGTEWSVDSSPNAPNSILNFPQTVSCVSPSFCVAIGMSKLIDSSGSVTIGTETQTWNGTSWSLLVRPNQGPILGVSCVASSACTAVGTDNNPLVESWDGSGWSVTPSATPPGDRSLLSSVSCAPSLFCMAVGGSTTGTAEATLAETGSTPTPTPMPPTTTTVTDSPTTTSSTSTTSTLVAVARAGTSGSASFGATPASSSSLAFTGPGRGLRWTTLIGSVLLVVGGALLVVAELPRRRRRHLVC